MSDQAAGSDREIVYVADPMCSWCWGFSPAVSALVETYGGRVAVTPIMGGLRPLTRDPMDDAAKATIRDHWTHVRERTGQPFDFAFFERDGFVYDTEPACRAVVTVRAINPGAALDYLARVHRAFYAEGRDVTDAAVLADIAEEAGVARADFDGVFPTRAAIYQTSGDFHTAHRLGATGFPTVLLRDGQNLQLLSAGYQPFDDLKPKIEAWLNAAAA
jgi:putative protein-disulfide isomerase